MHQLTLILVSIQSFILSSALTSYANDVKLRLTVPPGQTLELTTAMRMNVDKGVRDYQGNVRLVVDGNGAMAQRNDYYAYGGPWGDNAITQGFQPFKYNGKELDRVHGLDWYDYGARMYDPAMGLFTQVDLLAEQTPHLNPYMYGAGNPVKYVDPDGKKIVFVNGYLGFGSPEGGPTYWHGNKSLFVKAAQSTFMDFVTPFFTNYNFNY